MPDSDDKLDDEDLTKLLVAWFQSFSDIKSPLLNVYLFPTNIYYLVVLQMFRDFSGISKQVIKLNYNDSDDKIFDKIQKISNDDINIVFGISEISGKKDCSKVGKIDLIDRLPLWGISLKNNKKINKIKKSKFGNYLQLLSIKIFSGKFSLLLRDDLKGLSISIYPVGSTVERLFKKSVAGIENGIDFEHTNIELDHLFRGDVDLALTIQPWLALLKSQGNNLDIEVTYNHIGKSEKFTSLYMKKEENSDMYSDKLQESLLQSIQYILDNKIQKLYDANDEDIKQCAKYLKQLSENTKNKQVEINAEKSFDKVDFDDDCVIHKIGIEILNDSRIFYKTTLKSMLNAITYSSKYNFTKDKLALNLQALYDKESNVPEEFNRIYEIMNDPLYVFSGVMREENKLGTANHPVESEKGKSLSAGHEKYVKILSQICKEIHGEKYPFKKFENYEALEDYKQETRYRCIKRLYDMKIVRGCENCNHKRNDEICKEKYLFENDFEIYIPSWIDVIRHFLNDVNNEFKTTSCFCGEERERVLVVQLAYKKNNKSLLDLYKFKKGKFATQESALNSLHSYVYHNKKLEKIHSKILSEYELEMNGDEIQFNWKVDEKGRAECFSPVTLRFFMMRLILLIIRVQVIQCDKCKCKCICICM